MSVQMMNMIHAIKSSGSHMGKEEGYVCILGRKYCLPEEYPEFLADLRTRLWFTYRFNFPAIDAQGRYTSDQGWGCMLRCGQMVLAQAMLQRELGRDWRLRSNGDAQALEKYRAVAGRFADDASRPFSIHRIARTGAMFEKSVGQWFGPTTIAQVLRILNLANAGHAGSIATHIAMDGVVYRDLLEAAIDEHCDSRRRYQAAAANREPPVEADRTPCGSPSGSRSSSPVRRIQAERFRSPRLPRAKSPTPRTGRPQSPGATAARWRRQSEAVAGADRATEDVLLMIPLRLGLDCINPCYLDALKDLYSLPMSLGIVGGRPNSAHYFIGYRDHSALYLDPHTTQLAVSPADGKSPLCTDTFSCDAAQLVPFSRMDPSLALAFLLRGQVGIDEFFRTFGHLPDKESGPAGTHGSTNAPLFSVMDRAPPYVQRPGGLDKSPGSLKPPSPSGNPDTALGLASVSTLLSAKSGLLTGDDADSDYEVV